MDSKQKEYSLTFFERLIFQTIFPPTDGKGHYTEHILREKVIEKLISPEEREARNIAPVWICPKCAFEVKDSKKPTCSTCKEEMRDTKRIGWNVQDKEGKAILDEKVISFGEVTVKKITDALKELEEAGALGAEHRSLYFKIVLDGKEPEIEA